MKKLIKLVTILLAVVGFIAVYFLTDILFNINLLQPLWWLLGIHKKIMVGLGNGFFIGWIVFLIEYIFVINAYKSAKEYYKNRHKVTI